VDILLPLIAPQEGWPAPRPFALNKGITDALGTTEPESGPGDEGDDNTEPTA
jgi:hypothetical protein